MLPRPPEIALRTLEEPHDPRYLIALKFLGDQVHLSRSGAKRKLEPRAGHPIQVVLGVLVETAGEHYPFRDSRWIASHSK